MSPLNVPREGTQGLKVPPPTNEGKETLLTSEFVLAIDGSLLPSKAEA
jgi:hypothetical protein